MRDPFRVPLRVRFGGGVELGSKERFNPDVVPGIFSRVALEVPQRPCPRGWGNVQPSDTVDVQNEVETSDGSKCGGKDIVPDYVTFNQGNLVEVIEAFKSNSKNSVDLLKGQQGKINKIDKDGDILIDFLDHPKSQWVKRKNFSKLEDLSTPPLPVSGNGGMSVGAGTSGKSVQSFQSQQGGA